MRKRKGSILISLVLFVIVAGILLSVAPSPGTIVRTVSDGILKDQALVLDNALALWYSSHSGKYPNGLQVLQDMSIIASTISLGNFTYAVQNGQADYRLTVTLGDGTVFKSPGSTY